MPNSVTPPNLEDDIKAAPQADAQQDAEKEEPVDENENGAPENFFLKQLANLQEEVDEHKAHALRAMAEMENIRRRSQEEVQKASKFAIESFAEQLLSVKDSLEMALASPSEDTTSLRQGVELTLKQLSQAFERTRITEVASEGQPFDPNVHQAVTTIENDAPANTIVQVYQKGYRLNDRILRPALVVVSKG